MKPKKDLAVKLVMGENLDDTIGPSEKRKRPGQMQGNSQMGDEARFGMETRYASGMKARNYVRKNSRLKALDVEKERSPDAAEKLEEPAELDPSLENNSTRVVKVAVEKNVAINSARRLQEFPWEDVSLRGAAACPATNTRKESECVEKNAQDDTKRSDDTASTKFRYRRFESRLNEWLQKGEEVTVETDVDAARIVKRTGKTPIKPAKEEEAEIEVTMSALTQCQKSQVTLQRDAQEFQLEKAIIDLRRQKRKVEQDLIAMEKDAEDRRNLQQAHQRELDLAQGEFKKMTSMSLQDIMQIVKKNTGLENELVSAREEKDMIESMLGDVLKRLEEEKEKLLCQICLESPKDTLCFPCLHLNFCFLCLEKHREQNNSCPSCRTGITGVLRCDICI